MKTGVSGRGDRTNVSRVAPSAPGPALLAASIRSAHSSARRASSSRAAVLSAILRTLSTSASRSIAGIAHSSPMARGAAVAVSMAQGPEAALSIVDALCAAPALENYHLLYGVRGDILRKLGRNDEANDEFRKAAGLTRNAREKAFLLNRAEAGV